MAEDVGESDSLQYQLRSKLICRFCLTQQIEKLGSIYAANARLKSTTSLPLQIMACASIEVFSNDGMPSWICTECRRLFEFCYQFKQMCKRAETLLRQYPLVGKWSEPLAKPKFPQELQEVKQVFTTQKKGKPQTTTATTNTTATKAIIPIQKLSLKQKNTNLKVELVAPAPVKILNSNPVSSPEPPVPIRMKKETFDDQTTIFLSKVENDEELSLDDVQRLIASADNDDEFEITNDLTTVTVTNPLITKPKVKVLNKSSMRILNKEANVVQEPRLSKPMVKRDEDGNVAIVTEILDPNIPYEPEPDPITSAAPVETNVFPCPHCERSFPLLQLRDIHMVNHNRERSFQCGECQKSFFSKYDLQKHNLIHTGDKPFKCTVCDKAFTRSTLLHRHEKTHTDIPKFICVFCEKEFICKDEMEKHTERHRKNRPYQCKICNKAFAFKQGVERHEIIHSRVQPYSCQYCDLSFSTPSKLARHLTAHAGERPYPCKFCPKSYLLSHHLTRHLRSHKQGSVSYMCSGCDKVFKARDELIYHSAVHASKTMVCQLCNDKFKDIESVTAHIMEHVEGDAFACEFCDLIFMTSERLQEHTDVDHIEDMAAYHEDDKAQAQNANKNSKQEGENMNELQQTIDDFLIDEFPDEVMEAEENNDYDQDVYIKEEKNCLSDQPKILKQTVIDSISYINNPAGNDKCDEAIAVTNAAEEDVAGDDNSLDEENEGDKSTSSMQEQMAPSKIRKIVTINNQQPQQQKIPTKKIENQTSIIRRKVATRPTRTTTTTTPTTPMKTKTTSVPSIQVPQRQQIKIEKNELIISPTSVPQVKETKKQVTNINTVLKSLPKSVSVRRNTPTTSTYANQTTAATPTEKRSLRETTKRPSNVGTSPVVVESVVNANTKTAQIGDKRSSVASKISSSSTIMGSGKKSLTTSNVVGDVEAKVNVPEKKVKLQRITVTKAEAAALKREGRIRFKDGNMILTQNIPKSSK